MVRRAEGVVVVDLAVEALPDEESQIGGQPACQAQIEVFSLEVRIIDAVFQLLVKGRAGLDDDFIDPRPLFRRGRFLRPQSRNAAAQKNDRQKKLSHGQR